MVIGLTGQIGAGKSAAARILADFGALVVDADQIGKQVVDQSLALRRRLAKTFGSDIITPNGNLRRKRLASRAFVDDESKCKLNDLVHPHLLKELRNQAKQAAKTHDVVVIDAALLLYWGLDSEVDTVLVIHTSRERRYARMAERGISRTDAAAREKAQLPFAEFRRKADIFLLNNQDIEKLRIKLARVWKRLMREPAPRS